MQLQTEFRMSVNKKLELYQKKHDFINQETPSYKAWRFAFYHKLLNVQQQ